MCGAVAARFGGVLCGTLSMFFFEIFVCVNILGKQSMITIFNIMLLQMWCRLTQSRGSSYLNSSVTWQAWDNVQVSK